MISYRLKAPHGHTIDWLFLTCTFVHRHVAYRAAVAQNSHTAAVYETDRFGSSYHVLLQSDDMLYDFVMWRDDEDIWVCDEPLVLQEILFLLGNEITEGD